MPKILPLQLLVFRHPDDADVRPYEDAATAAFEGGKEPVHYLGTAEDLGIQVRRFSSAPAESAAKVLDEFAHTLVMVLIDDELLRADRALWNWLGDCWAHVSVSNGRHSLLAVPMEERLGARFTGMDARLATLQVRPVEELGEKGIRPAMLALRALHEGRLLLARGLPSTHGNPSGFLRLFISHAKIDGLPLAQALKYHIKNTAWLTSFYDADDLPAGSNWEEELKQGVGASVIIMLRTEVYETRYWCQQEVRWADEYATPAVLVEARTGLNHAGASLPFDRVPTARIPDGNLIRVLFLALREALRFLHFMRLVEEMKREGEIAAAAELHVFSLAPSSAALLRACKLMSKKGTAGAGTRLIVYPDPPLPTGAYEAAEALVEKFAPGVQLTTPNTIAALTGSTP